MNDLTTTKASETFRAKASDVFHAAADMTLHQLVDEYARLTSVIENGKVTTKHEFGDSEEYSDEALIAQRERNIIVGATRARFGFGFDTYDYDF